jgi:hypothetical protein
MINFTKAINCLVLLVLILQISSLQNINKPSNFHSRENKPFDSNFLELHNQQDKVDGLQQNSNKSTEDEPKPMENNGYLFYGYNLYLGNPHTTEGSIDPGFTNPIFETTYTENILTGDLRFKIPDGSIFGKNVGCDMNFTQEGIKDGSSYMDALEAEVSASGGIGVYSFSGSAEMKLVVEKTKSSDQMFVETKAECRVFSGHLDYYRPPRLHPTFVKAIDTIDEKEFKDAKEDYFNFINYFGTHFVRNIDMGSRFGYLEKVKTSDFQSNNYFSAGVSIEGSGLGWSASAKVSGEKDRQKSGSTSNKNVRIFSIGATLPTDGNALTWAAKSVEEPMPIKYHLDNIENIFTNPLFNLDQLKDNKGVKIDISKFKKNLDAALDAYCPEYLKVKGLTSYCNDKEYQNTIQQNSSNPIKDQAIIRIKSFYNHQCLQTWQNGENDKMNKYFNTFKFITTGDCDSPKSQFKLIWEPKLKAFKVLTNGPPSDGMWSYDASNVLSGLILGVYQQGVDLSRHFKFEPNDDGTFSIISLQHSNSKYCLGADKLLIDMIRIKQCSSDRTKFIITSDS